MTVFCDNDGCMFSDGCGFCDCDKLSIVGGVCAGSYRSGRNTCDRDVDERLKAENAKLRELVDALMGCGTRYHTMSGACPMFDANAKDCCKAEEIARELGVEAE